MKIISILGLLLILTSCQSFKEKVGLVKDQPDEYQVVTNPPLSVPEDLVTVKAPEDLEQNKSVADQKNLTKGENSILKQMNKQ
jgi:hypothetical protein